MPWAWWEHMWPSHISLVSESTTCVYCGGNVFNPYQFPISIRFDVALNDIGLECSFIPIYMPI
jgi:hypothetical protein